MRRQALVAQPIEISFFQNMSLTILLSLAAPWLAILLPRDLWLPMAGVTALSGWSGQLMMSWSYRRAEAQYLIPTEYTAFVWAMLLGWLFFAELVTWSTLAGAALIIVGCLTAARSRPAASPNRSKSLRSDTSLSPRKGSHPLHAGLLGKSEIVCRQAARF